MTRNVGRVVLSQKISKGIQARYKILCYTPQVSVKNRFHGVNNFGWIMINRLKSRVPSGILESWDGAT